MHRFPVIHSSQAGLRAPAIPSAQQLPGSLTRRQNSVVRATFGPALARAGFERWILPRLAPLCVVLGIAPGAPRAGQTPDPKPSGSPSCDRKPSVAGGSALGW